MTMPNTRIEYDTLRALSCDTCRTIITDPDEMRPGLCTDCLSIWFSETVAAAPATLEVPFAAIRETSFGHDSAHELTVAANEDADTAPITGVYCASCGGDIQPDDTECWCCGADVRAYAEEASS